MDDGNRRRALEHCCPITMGVMEDAVVPADGYPYERAAILRHFEENGGFKALMQLIKKGNKELSRII